MPKVSLRRTPSREYPPPDWHYAPDTRFPEYQFDSIAESENDVYATVRQIFADLGCDLDRFGHPDWNPLSKFVQPGQTIFLLCNFVYQRRVFESTLNFSAKCTHGSVIRAVADYALKAVGPTGRVMIGNAALQSCSFEAVLADCGVPSIKECYLEAQIDNFEVRDLRQFRTTRTAMGRVVSEGLVEVPSIDVVLGSDSWLARFGPKPSRFRISDYDATEVTAFHSANKHIYRISQSILAADLVISVPKLKTHEKVGITVGLKGLVGIVARKECLAHHRFGGPEEDGDEYPASSRWRRWMSSLHDYANDRSRPRRALLEVLDRNLRRAVRVLGLTQSGAWAGNDTAWRMTLDLLRIVQHADIEGRMQPEPVRKQLVIVDGIVAGEGEGPLDPIARREGALIGSDDLVAGDRVACRLMGFDEQRVPMLRAAIESGSSAEFELMVDGMPATLDSIECSSPFTAPSGWLGRVELR